MKSTLNCIIFLFSHLFIAVKVEGQPCEIDNHESIASNIDFIYNLQDNYGTFFLKHQLNDYIISVIFN